MTPSRSRTRSRSSSPTSEGSWKPVASLGSSIRSAARATYSAYKRQPIRWRLAGGSAALTLVILLGFAVIVGTLTTRAIYSDFNRQVASGADRLQQKLVYTYKAPKQVGQDLEFTRKIDLDAWASSYNAAIRVVYGNGRWYDGSVGAPNFGQPNEGTSVIDGWRVETRQEELFDPVRNRTYVVFTQFG